MTTCVALLRGINVGKAKRVAMADLRELLEGLGYTDVRTLLNSGNAVFRAPGSRADAGAIEAAIVARFGFSAAVVTHTAAELDAIVAENPLPQAESDPSRFLVAFVASSDALAAAGPLADQSWTPEALAVGPRAAYVWCANGIAVSELVPALSRATRNAITTRNWATVLKLQALARR